MKETNFSTTNRNIIEHKPFFNSVIKTFNNSYKGESIYTRALAKNKRVLFICDFEGKILSIGSPFSDIDCEFKNVLEKSILDYIHQEDIYFVIEHLVKLLQEKTDSVVFEARFLCKKNQFLYIKWHVGYLCGMFFFYPVNMPKNGLALNENSKLNAAPIPSIQIDLNEFFWKLEVEKTLFEWDQLFDKHLEYCFNV